MDIQKSLSGLQEFNMDVFLKRQNGLTENSEIDPSTLKLNLFKPVGCDKCDKTGYSGREGIFEVLKVDEKISQLVMQQRSGEDIENEAIKNGMMSMLQDGYIKALEGMTTIEEILRVVR